MSEGACPYRKLFANDLRMACFDLDSVLEFGSVEAIKQCVMAGLGVAVLPEVSVLREVAAGELVKLNWAGTNLTMETQLVWHKERWQSPALLRFIEICIAQISQRQLSTV